MRLFLNKWNPASVGLHSRDPDPISGRALRALRRRRAPAFLGRGGRRRDRIRPVFQTGKWKPQEVKTLVEERSERLPGQIGVNKGEQREGEHLGARCNPLFRRLVRFSPVGEVGVAPGSICGRGERVWVASATG